MSFQTYLKNPWVISQYWSDLTFLNYQVDPALIQSRLPKNYEVDTYEGHAYLSIVPFKMSKIRFPLTPAIPYSDLHELNIRTYVKVKGESGIYFFTLDTDHAFGAWFARNFFSLPYRHTELSSQIDGRKYAYQGNHLDLSLTINNKIEKNDFTTWITERYSLFTNKKNAIYQGIAMHEPWQLRAVTIEKCEQTFLEEFSFNQTTYHSSFAGDAVEVTFKPFKRVL